MSDEAYFLVNRIEVIDHTSTAKEPGRVLVKWDETNFEVTFSEQDEGRTLKIFLTDEVEGDHSK